MLSKSTNTEIWSRRPCPVFSPLFLFLLSFQIHLDKEQIYDLLFTVSFHVCCREKHGIEMTDWQSEIQKLTLPHEMNLPHKMNVT